MSTFELLAPAKDCETGIAAVSCGADAVYIGASRFGAREAAANSLPDIERLVAYAHRYWARVYAAVNTILRDDEIDGAAHLCQDLYQIGVDGLIVQDLGLLECDLPPLPLIASTQMHNHTPERVAFWQKAGFSRVILARELELEQIRAIRSQTSIELEAFVHGALCVSYSGQCYLSYALGGRSGNRGQCAQPCRRLYTLEDGQGQTLVRERHLLSLRDLNLSAHLRSLIEAGVTSFKIEGRLKNQAYVCNIVGHYRRQLDAVLSELGGRRASSGISTLGFSPDPDKTFNRGYTTYFLQGRGDPVASPDSPKHVGEPIGQVKAVRSDSFTLETAASLHSGDGLTFFAANRELQGALVNQVQGATVFPQKLGGIERGVRVFRNHDHAFVSALERSENYRRISLVLRLRELDRGFRLEATDEDGVSASHELICEKIPAHKPELARPTIERQLAKLGESDFVCQRVELELQQVPHLAHAVLNGLRRDTILALVRERERQRPRPSGAALRNEIPFPEPELGFAGNVLNQKAAAFYRRHGVHIVEPAAESGLEMKGRLLMTTRYCIKWELGFCPRHHQGTSTPAQPWFLVDDEGRRLRLEFDCQARCCTMRVFWAAS